MSKYDKKPKQTGRSSGSKNKALKPVGLSVDKIYTVTQTASILQVSEQTIRNLVKRCALPASSTSAGLRIKGLWIDQYLEETVLIKEEK